MPISRKWSHIVVPLTCATAAAGAVWRYSKEDDAHVVVGGGVMGRSIAAEIASRGQKVILIDESHIVRSSWGDTRGLQNGYTGVYAKLVKRAAQLWKTLQTEDIQFAEDSGRGPLFINTSNMFIASSRQEAEKAQREHQREGLALTSEVMDRQTAKKLFPAVELYHEQHAFIDKDCLILSALDCMHAIEDKAVRHGAVIHFDERVDSIDVTSRKVVTNSGRSIRYSKLVLAVGPWTNRTLTSAGLKALPLFVSAEQLMYLIPKKKHDTLSRDATDGTEIHDSPVLPLEAFSGLNLPILHGEVYSSHHSHVHSHGSGASNGLSALVYAIPILPGGKQAVKCAVHMMGELLHTEEFQVLPGSTPCKFDDSVYHRRGLLCRRPESDELDKYQKDVVLQFVQKYLPSLDVESINMVCRCLYTSAPDNDFVVGYHPDVKDGSVVVVTGFHGEGFKFAPVIAECVTEMLLHDGRNADVSELTKELLLQCSPSRFFVEQ